MCTSLLFCGPFSKDGEQPKTSLINHLISIVLYHAIFVSSLFPMESRWPQIPSSLAPGKSYQMVLVQQSSVTTKRLP